MTALARILDLIPPPYAIDADGTLASFVDGFALECDAIQEDIDRLRRSHWVNQAYNFDDLRKIGALFNIPPLAWEEQFRDHFSYRARLVPLIAAQLNGALGPKEILTFVAAYMRRAEESLAVTHHPLLPDELKPGRERRWKEELQPLELREFPIVTRRSKALAARGGFVPVLHRWEEHNQGLEDSVATLRIMGIGDKKTTVPVVLNLTTGDMILYADTLGTGSLLSIHLDEAATDGRTARATINGLDVTHKLKSASGVRLGEAGTIEAFEDTAMLPRFVRGVNEWIFLSVGYYDLPSLDRTFFALAEDTLREGRFDETNYDHSLFPSGARAYLDMSWQELEAASFQVRVPRKIVSSPATAHGEAKAYDLIAEGLSSSLQSLHAAGVRAELRFEAFHEEQPQFVRSNFSWLRPEPQKGSAGQNDELALGMHFGETGLGQSRFE